MRSPYSFSVIALDKFNLAVRPTRLSYLLDGVMRLQFSLRALFQLAMNSFVVGIPTC